MYSLTVPVLIRRANGGYLAVSEPGSSLRIGVEGSTEAEARQRFTESLAEWVKLGEVMTGQGENEIRFRQAKIK